MDRIGIDGINGVLGDTKRRDRFSLKFRSPRGDATDSAAPSSAADATHARMKTTTTTTAAAASRSRSQKPERYDTSETSRTTDTGGSSSTTKKHDARKTANHGSHLDRIDQNPINVRRRQQRAAGAAATAAASGDINSSASSSTGTTIELLKAQGFPTGLAMALHTNSKVFDHRIWIVDNSASMELADGHRVVMTSDRKMVIQDVTRWEELQDTVTYHAEMAVILQSPTVFTLLNHPGPGFDAQHFRVGSNEKRSGHHHGDHRRRPNRDSTGAIRTDADIDLEAIRNAGVFIRRVKPSGTTPLTDHVWKIQESVHALAPQLRRDGRRVAIVLATDGLPTDPDGYIGEDINAEFLSALRSLEGLPVWVVIRLCTDEAKVTKFYNSLDCVVNLSLEVLDDYLGEAEEIRRHNKWLNYCLPLHRCRELGYHNRVFDFLDERPLTRHELRDFCSVLFGTPREAIPDPIVAWTEFLAYIQDELRSEQEHFDPLLKKMGPWINVKALHRIYGKKKCTIC